tara:strand:+ start:161 stop:1582 length:1422 start_codon:yes stop_codon:yes gene_type:complete
MAFGNASNYSKFQVIKRLTFEQDAAEGNPFNGNIEKKVNIEGKILGFNYYESIYSPMVTASFLMQSTGGDTSGVDDFAGTLKDAAKIRGFEEVLIKVKNESGVLDWTKKKRRFKIIGSPFNVDDPQKQTAYFSMVSMNGLFASNMVVKKAYGQKGKAKVSDCVKKMLDNGRISTDYENYDLKGTWKKENIHNTENNMKITGNNEPLLDTINALCPKSIPEGGGDPGYFFFENIDGYNYKSIHMMIMDGYEQHKNKRYRETHTYTYKAGASANLDLQDDPNDYKVLLTPIVRRDQDAINALKNGTYNVRVCVINAQTHEYNEKIYTIHNNDRKTITLGDGIEINPQNIQELNPESYCQTHTFYVDPNSEVEGGGEITEDLYSPDHYLPRALMRYGLLHAQLVEVQVPCNLELTVGELIQLNIENITQDPKILKEYNDHRSGLYLILHLCHYFDMENSYTSLTLARDEYGKPRQF